MITSKKKVKQGQLFQSLSQIRIRGKLEGFKCNQNRDPIGWNHEGFGVEFKEK